MDRESYSNSSRSKPFGIVLGAFGAHGLIFFNANYLRG